jgi:O-antigen/teichoic acid export membrane protein
LVILLGEKFNQSIIPFQIILIASFVSVIGMPYGNILSAMGKFYIQAYINIFRLLLFVVSLFLFVSPRFLNMGAIGLAISILLINIVLNVLYQYYSAKLGKLKVEFKNLYKYAVITLAALLVYVIYVYFELYSLLGLAFLSLLFTLVTYTTLYFLGLMKTHHIELLTRIIKVKDLKNYIKKDFSNN